VATQFAMDPDDEDATTSYGAPLYRYSRHEIARREAAYISKQVCAHAPFCRCARCACRQ